MFIHSFRRLLTDQEGAEQQDYDTDANRGVRDIKDIKGPERAKMEVEEVYHISVAGPIDDISQRAPQNHGQGKLVAAGIFLADPPGDANCDRGGHADQDPAVRVVLRLGDAQADPAILDPGEIEKGQQVDVLHCFQVQRAGDQPFAELVDNEDQQGEQVRLCLEPLPPFPLRRVSIKRLLTNLIENALRYGGNGVEVAAFLAGDNAAPYVVLSVLDRGQGIDPSELQDIFNPFIRGDRARGGKGTGLGLAIVKRIAAQHGGSVELRNRSGGGLEARVCLPLGLMLPRDAV